MFEKDNVVHSPFMGKKGEIVRYLCGIDGGLNCQASFQMHEKQTHTS